MTHTWHSDVVNNDTNASELAQTHSTKWTWSNTVQYNFDIVENHNLNVLVGLEAHQDNGIDFAGRRVDYPLETIDYMVVPVQVFRPFAVPVTAIRRCLTSVKLTITGTTSTCLFHPASRRFKPIW